MYDPFADYKTTTRGGMSERISGRRFSPLFDVATMWMVGSETETSVSGVKDTHPSL